MKASFSKANVFFLLFITLFISACSSSLFYRNLNWITLWYVNDYVSLSAEQKKMYTSEFNDLQRWHREYELENYQLLLSSIESQINSGTLGPDQLEKAVNNHHNTVRSLWKNLATQLTPHLYDLSRQLSKQQQQELLQNLATKNQIHYEKYNALSKEEWQAKKSKNLTKALTRWTGSLTYYQKKLVQQWASELHRLDHQHYQFRQQWLDELDKVLQLPEKQLKSELTKLLADREAFMPSEYRQQLITNRQLTEQLIVKIISLRTESQQKKIVREIHRWLEVIGEEIQS